MPWGDTDPLAPSTTPLPGQRNQGSGIESAMARHYTKKARSTIMSAVPGWKYPILQVAML